MASWNLLDALLLFGNLPNYSLLLSQPEVPPLFIYLFNSCPSFQTWVKHPLPSSVPCFLPTLWVRWLTLCSLLVLRKATSTTSLLLLGSLTDLGLPEDRDFVLLVSILDELAIKLSILGSFYRSCWTCGGSHKGFIIRASYRVLARI